MLRFQRSIPVLIFAAVIVLASATLPAYARDNEVVTVNGEVISPNIYSRAQLAELPQTPAIVTVGNHQVTYTGVLLETLVATAKPAYPANLLNTKNELLRVTVTVRGKGHEQVTFAVGGWTPTSATIPPCWP